MAMAVRMGSMLMACVQCDEMTSLVFASNLHEAQNSYQFEHETSLIELQDLE